MPAITSARLTPLCLGSFLLLAIGPLDAAARNTIRRAFFDAYPQATGTRLDTLPSNAQHCGICHFNFDGGGPRNAYGLAVQSTPNRTAAEIYALGTLDSDGDGYANHTEIIDPGPLYSNTPTFPGLTAASVGSVSNVSLAEISGHLTPSSGPDTTPPAVTVLTPNGGEVLTANAATLITWSATDPSGIAAIDLLLSLDDGATYKLIAIGLANTGSYTWHPANRPALAARIRVAAVDAAGNPGADASDAGFAIVPPPGGRVPTTLRDFDMPGTQPFGAAEIVSPADCRLCHGDYDLAVEPSFNWRGGLMSHASIDPIFLAALDVANQDAPESGDLCLRCHDNRGWLAGRSTPTDGSRMLPEDLIGVNCNLCHRMVDPFYADGVSPVEDLAILAGLDAVPAHFTTGQFVIEPDAYRMRGPFVDAVAAHEFLVSPFHREAAFCGTCHDVSNPAFDRNPDGSYSPNAFDTPAASFGPHQIGAVERTYSEWLNSAYNSPLGVYAPQFGGNREYVSTCQHCHMRAVTGAGCNLPFAPLRDDLPLHDLTGGSTWLPGVLHLVDPTVDPAALSAGVVRARYMLQHAAELTLDQAGQSLAVRVTNKTGHKLPTGYPEGRRMWLNVRFYDADETLLGESGHYDAATAELVGDAEIKVYEALPVISAALAPIVGLPPFSEFHFVLNDAVLKDNRIPPLGFSQAAFAAFGGAPVGASYADGQNYDVTQYVIPTGAARAEVTLYYQSLSREFVEFLRDNATPGGAGQTLYALWFANGKCPPEPMATVSLALTTVEPADVNCDGTVDFFDIDPFLLTLFDPAGYADVYPNCDIANADVNRDGSVDFFDIDPFLMCLFATCP